MSGPFDQPPFKNFICNPIFAVPKNKDPNCDTFRRIDHLSHPKHQSVNDGIDKTNFPVKFPTIDFISARIRRLGIGTLLCKEDLSNAYKQIRINPSSWPYTGVKFQGKFYFSGYLVFGARSSVGIFERFSSVLEWILLSNGIDHVLHYLDDFLLLSPLRAISQQKKFLQIAQSLGWKLKDSKRVTPTTKLTYLGITFDTKLMTMSMPKYKLDEVVELCKKFTKSTRTKISKKELRSLLGKLAHIYSPLCSCRKSLSSTTI